MFTNLRSSWLKFLTVPFFFQMCFGTFALGSRRVDAQTTTSTSSSSTSSSSAADLSTFLDSYQAGLTTPISTSSATRRFDSTYETYYAPWCEYNSGSAILGDPANLYGCSAGTCSCTGEE